MRTWLKFDPTTLWRRPVRLWCLAFVAYFLVIGAWALAQPYDASADEHDHIYRAYGVAAGQIAPKPTKAVRGSGAFQTVAKGLVRPFLPNYGANGRPSGGTQPCWIYEFNTSVACAEPPSADRTPVLIGTGAGRYNPIYYAIVGQPLVWWPGWPGVLLARLISAAMCAGLLAGALAAVVRHSRYGAMFAGLLVAITPLSLQFMGSVNPNGVEIAACIAFFAAAIPLFVDRVSPRSKGLLSLAGTSGVALAVLRPTGFLFLAVAAVAFLIPLRIQTIRAVLRVRAARLWTVAIAVAAAFAAVWVVAMKSTNPGNVFAQQHYTLSEAVAAELSRWTTTYVPEFIGAFDWTELRLPELASLIWALLAVGLPCLGFLFGRWVDRWRLFVVFVGGAVVPSAIQIAKVNTIGFVTQGRYLLPVLDGLVLLGVYVFEQRGLDRGRARSLVRLYLAVLIPFQLYAFDYMVVRWQRGLPADGSPLWFNPFEGTWHPVVGSVLPVGMIVAGLAGLTWMAWRVSARPGEVETQTDGPGRPRAVDVARRWRVLLAADADPTASHSRAHAAGSDAAS